MKLLHGFNLPVLLVCLLIAHGVHADTCTTAPNGLVGLWSAEGNATDTLGVNNGTLVNDVTYGLGKAGQAFYFDGDGDQVTLGNSAAFQLQNFTIEAWIKRSSSTQASLVAVDGLLFSYGDDGYGLGIYDDGRLFLSNIGNSYVANTAQLTDTSFHHVAVTKTNSSVIFYVDGVASGIINYNTTFAFTTPLTIGASGNGFDSFLGAIDEASLYRRALSGAEIQALYNSGSAGKCGIPPAFTSQPVSQSAFVGETIFFSGTVFGAVPLSYQWKLNGSNISGATTTVLSLNNVQFTNAGSYTLSASNLNGSTLSSNALLTVSPAPACVPAPTGIVGWWRAEGNATEAIGGNNGTLNGDATYRAGRVGQAFGFDGIDDWISLGDPTNLQLQNFTIEGWIKRDSSTSASPAVGGGLLFSHNVDGFGLGIQDSGRLLLSKIGVNQVLSTATLTDTQSFHHVAVTKTNSTVVFYIDGVPSAPVSYNPTFTFGGGVAIGASGGGANSFIGAVDEISIYKRALTSNEIQAVFAAASTGKCTGPTAPYIFVQPADRTATAGTQVDFSVVAAGGAPLSYQWIYNGTNVNNATNGSLSLTNVQLAQVGTYSVVVSNALGSVTSSNAVLLVLTPPIITNQPQSQFVTAGTDVTFSVGATGSAPLNFHWQKGGNNIPSATNSSLLITNIVATNADTYRVIVSNPVGSVTSSNAVLQLNPTILINGLIGSSFSYTNVASAQVQITSTFSNAAILYTLDGSTPDFDSIFYSGSFLITQSCVVRAVAYDASFNSAQSAPVSVSLWRTYALTVVNPGGGSVALNPSVGVYRNDQVVQATATASNGWTFIQWAGDASGTNPVVNVSMEKPKSINAIFGAPVSVTAPANGVIRLNPTLSLYPYGSLVQACGIPSNGYAFSIWGGTQINPTNPLPLTVTTTNLSVTALFSLLTGGKFALTVVPNGAGTVSVNPRANNFSSGASVNITATPLSSNVFYYWSGDATGTNNPLAVTMNTSKVITVNFSGGDFPIQLGVARTNNSIRLSLAGEPTKVFDVQSSTNLSNWGTISTLTNTNGTLIFNDSLTSSNTFYRAKLH